MPTSAKPKKKFKRKFQVPGERRPGIDEAMIVFSPLFKLFEQLEAGEVDDAAGRPIMLDWQGDYCEIAPALMGWADCWQRIADAESIPMDVEPLRKISRKLHAVSPLTETEVLEGKKAMLHTHRAFLKLPVGTIKRHANNEEIAIGIMNMSAGR